MMYYPIWQGIVVLAVTPPASVIAYVAGKVVAGRVVAGRVVSQR